ncbi:MAG: DUF2889 domain-containing protein [Desulfomonilaceae bacterium]
MLEYSRMKSIGVQVQGEDRRVVSGVLEDELYAMQCEIVVNWPTLTIERVQTRMKRFTTTRCPLAQTVFPAAEGWKIDSQLEGKIKKELGRKGCRHMAILILDCCRSLARAEFARELRAALEQDPNLDGKGFLKEFLGRYSELTQFMRLQ